MNKNYIVDNESDFNKLKDVEKLEVLLCKELAISTDTTNTTRSFLNFLIDYKTNLENQQEQTEKEIIKELISDLKAIFKVFSLEELFKIKESVTK